MIVIDISEELATPFLCKVELTLEETEAILHSLSRTMCSGNELTISMELEDKLLEVLKPHR